MNLSQTELEKCKIFGWLPYSSNQNLTSIKEKVGNISLIGKKVLIFFYFTITPLSEEAPHD